MEKKAILSLVTEKATNKSLKITVPFLYILSAENYLKDSYLIKCLVFLCLTISQHLISLVSTQNLKWEPRGNYWEPIRNPEKQLRNDRGNMGESCGNHRGIIWEIGEALRTQSPTPTTSHIRRWFKVDNCGFFRRQSRNCRVRQILRPELAPVCIQYV